MSVALALSALAELQTLKIDRDDVRVDRSCTLEIAAHPIADANGDGVIQIVGDDLTIDFGKTALIGARSGALPDSFAGVGVRVTGKRVTIRNARVSGFHAAIWATKTDGLVLENCDVSGNWCQRLRSTEKAEDGADWLFPHENDQNQWLLNYGAGIYVEESSHVTVRGCRAEHGQNGLLLRKVVDSLVIDNDFSFLSGWGIGMFRCERDRVLNNACDF
jgi:nitrous oxidase accessory protein NosD